MRTIRPSSKSVYFVYYYTDVCDSTLICNQTKTSISFLCKQGLNPRSLIQPSKILPVELTGTHENN